ncbi:MAG TPA: chorismate mutase [Solibacterales bacterium]|nr:chorismate mutase [Bryobacterales bacterium]
MTPEQAAQALAVQRSRIDTLDLRLLELFNERALVVQEIGRIKQQVEMPIYEPKREEEVFRNVLGHNSGPLPNDAVKRLFERIIDEMRTVQKKQMERSGGPGR